MIKKNNKKVLYESVMRQVANVVKKTLNESIHINDDTDDKEQKWLAAIYNPKNNAICVKKYSKVNNELFLDKNQIATKVTLLYEPDSADAKNPKNTITFTVEESNLGDLLETLYIFGEVVKAQTVAYTSKITLMSMKIQNNVARLMRQWRECLSDDQYSEIYSHIDEINQKIINNKPKAYLASFVTLFHKIYDKE